MRQPPGHHPLHDATESASRLLRSSIRAIAPGLLAAVWYAGEEPQPVNASAISLQGVRAVGASIVVSEAPVWSGVDGVLDFAQTPYSMWFANDEMLPANADPVQYTLTSAELTAKLSVVLLGYAVSIGDDPFVGFYNMLSFGPPPFAAPAAPAADTAALQSQPRGAVTAPGEATIGGQLVVTVREAYNGTAVDGWLYSTPVYLGQAVVTGGTATFTVPAGAAAGSHSVAVQGPGGALIGWAPLSIIPASGSGGGDAPAGGGEQIANTGAESLAPGLATAALLLLAGSAFVLPAVRRRQTGS